MDKMKNIRFFSMFYVDLAHRHLSHNVDGFFDKQMQSFIGCCETLSLSLKKYTGIELTVITNNKKYLLDINPRLNCVEIEFSMPVPIGIDFYAAHFKIDIYKYFSELDSQDYLFLIDSDVVCINPMPENMVNCIEMGLPMYYDMTSQYYPAYGRDVMIETKKLLLGGAPSTGMWIGGEFIGGCSEFFSSLVGEVGSMWPVYLENQHRFFHKSDETLVSVAIERMMRTRHIVNVGDFGGIGKYWSCPTLHVQRPLDSFADHFLLHLPADKDYLGILKDGAPRFIKRYRRRLWIRKVSPLYQAKKIYGFLLLTWRKMMAHIRVLFK